MELKKGDLRRIFGYAALLILLYWSLQNLVLLGGTLGTLLGMITPFLLGMVLAFIINVPMVQVERLLFKNATGRKKNFGRVVSLVVTVALLIGVIFVVLFLVVPQLAASVATLGNSIPGYLAQVTQWAQQLAAAYPELAGEVVSVNLDWNGLLASAMTVIQNSVSSVLSSTVNVAAGIFSGVFSFLLAAVFAVYVLLQKEKIAERGSQVLRVLAPAKFGNRALYVLGLTHRTFASFLSGQCLEAVILGVMFFLAMSILRLPYALMISVLIGFTALIPIFGAFIGCAVGAFLLLMVNPIQAVWFLILFIILQQVEGNLIYPKVVGGSIGLPAIWVLLAVTVGGSALGIVGMLIFIPLASVFYTLFWEAVNKRTPKVPAEVAGPVAAEQEKE